MKKSVVRCTNAVAKKCKYGTHISGALWACDYIGENKKRRPCHWSECTEFEKRGAIKNTFLKEE